MTMCATNGITKRTIRELFVEGYLYHSKWTLNYGWFHCKAKLPFFIFYLGLYAAYRVWCELYLRQKAEAFKLMSVDFWVFSVIIIAII